MLKIGISLIVGFALEYAVCEWAFRQMRGCTMQGLKHAGGFLVGRESLETNPAPLNDKAGNFAGVGENGSHRVQWKLRRG